MKFRYFLTFFSLLFLTLNVNAQGPNLLWAKKLGGSGYDRGYSVFVDNSGNVYTTGYFTGTVDFDPGPATYNLTVTAFQSVFVSKLDPSGNFLWAKMWGDGTGYSIAFDAVGNVYTTGSFTGTVDFDPGPGIYNLTCVTTPNNQAFISKLDPSGNFIWARQCGGHTASSIAIGQNGNVAITGGFTGKFDFDPGPGVFNLTSVSSSEDFYVTSLDASGNFLWAKRIGGTGLDYAYSIAIDAQGNVYTIGLFQSTVDFDPGPGVFNLTQPLTSVTETFVSKLDASGNFVWAKNWGAPDNSVGEAGRSIVLDATGNIYTTGSFNSTADFDPGPGTYNLTSIGNSDIFVSKLDPSGNFLWAARNGGANLDQGLRIAVDASANVYVSGQNSSGNGMALKFDALGNFVWEAPMGKICNAIAVDAQQNIYTTGYFNGTSDFDPGNGIFNLTALGGDDIFIVKLCHLEAPVISGPSSFCQGSSVTLSASSANAYLWSNGATTQSINVATSGNYSVMVSNASGCSATSLVTTVSAYGFPAIPTISVSGSATICQGGSVLLTSSTAASYLWSNGDTTETTTVNAAGDYKVTISNAAGCTAISSPTTISVNPLPTVNANASVSSVCMGSPVTLTGSGASTYAWSNGVLNGVPFNPTATTTYTVTGTDTNTGCQNTATKTITVNPLPTVSANASVPSVCMGSAVTLTGSGASTYAWSNGVLNGVPFVPTATTTYTVTGTDTNTGCQNTATKTINVNPLPNVSANTSVPSVCNGSAVTLTGSGASTYTWSNGVLNGVSFVPTATTTYTVTGTDTNTGCQNTATKTITVNPLPNVSANASVPSVCMGSAVTLTGSGASTYTWSNGVLNGVSFNPTATTTYTVTGTDTNTGCQNTATKTITVNPLPSVSANASQTSVCMGSAVTLTGSGASTYTWSNGVLNGVPFVPTATITYTVTGTDTNTGCQNTATKTITVNPLPSVGANASQTTVCSGTAVTLSGSGANSYIWSNGVLNGAPFVPTVTTTYTVTGTDTNTGCQNTATKTIVVNALPTIVANASQTTVCSGTTVTLSGSGASSYTWSNGVLNGVSFVPTATTTYTVTGTDTNTGCQNTATKTITVNPLPSVVANADQTSVCRGTSVTLTGNGASTYSWSNGVLNGVSFVPTATATYTVTGIDGNGCSNTASIALTVNPLPTVNLGPDINLPTGPAILNATGPGLTYLWSTGAITPTISVTSTGIYSVTVTNTFNCTATDIVAVHFTVSSSDLGHESSLVIFPNPVQDILSILCEGSATTSAQVIDNLGRIVLEDNNVVADGAIRTLNLENMPAGIYYIRLTDKGFTRTASILKQ